MMTSFERIRLMVLDVDGTLTDGGIYYDSEGAEMKRFDVKDGLGIKVAKAAGIEFAILTGRKSVMVERRGRELGIDHIRTGIQIKYPALLELLAELDIAPEECGYIGDDLNDYQAMQIVGFKACPGDAAEEIQQISDYVAKRAGGHGAVRECLEFLLREKGVWNEYARKIYAG